MLNLPKKDSNRFILNIIQCKNLNQEIMKELQNPSENSKLKKIFEVDVILVSPYYRALETCQLVFDKCSAPVIV